MPKPDTAAPRAAAVDFYFDFSSPYSYLACGRVEAICRRRGAELVWRPILLGPIFRELGREPLFLRAAEGGYARLDLERLARRLGVPLVFPPRFPVASLRASRGAFFAGGQGAGAAYCRRVLEACWGEGRDIGDESVLDDVVSAMGLDLEGFRRDVARQEIKDRLRRETDGAARRGVFGAPTFFVDGEMFYGQDRLDELDAALKGRAAGEAPDSRTYPTPFNAWFEIRCTHREPGVTHYELEVDDHLLNKRGVAHGGAISSLLDTAMGGAVVASLRPEEWCATVELSIQFRAPARKGLVTGRGRMIRRGRRIAFVEGDVIDSRGKVLAAAHGSWYIWPARPKD